MQLIGKIRNDSRFQVYLNLSDFSKPKKCPTFKMVLDKATKFFGMDVKATRFNWYRDSNDWKPFHHDAAAVKEDKGFFYSKLKVD